MTRKIDVEPGSVNDVVAEVMVRQGPREAGAEFSLLADRYLDSAYRMACVILGDPIEAEDAAHDAAILAWRSFDRLRDRERFEAWLCRIVANVCRDRMRHRRRHPTAELPADDEVRDFQPEPDSSAGLLRRDAIERAFAGLDPDERIVVVLRFYRDLQIDDIADRLGIPSGTVKSRLHKSLHRLRAELERQGWREEA